MAETSFIIQNGRRLNLSDTVARKSIGSCSELETDTKHCLVDAINELCHKVETGGVESFNGREGAVVPATGDYTAAMVGAEPEGLSHGTYTITTGSDDDFLDVINTVYGGMSDDTVRYIVVGFSIVGHPVIGGGRHLFKIYRATETYGAIETVCYSTAGIASYCRSLYNGVWKAFAKNLDTANIASYAAPGGYGWGVSEIATAPNDSGGYGDANLITKTGLYRALENCPQSGWQYILHLNYASGYWIQLCWHATYNNAGFAFRRSSTEGISDWEWNNPPMALGVEYRTTERYLGKPVYEMLFNFGALPNTASTVVTYSDDTNCKFISASGNLNYGKGNAIPGSLGAASTQQVAVGGNGNSVWITTFKDYSSENAYLRIKYWKTTD